MIKKLYSYDIDTNDVKERCEVGEYFMSHRRPLELGDYVVLNVYPPIPDDPTLDQMIWSQDNEAEYCVLGKVSRFTEDKSGVFFMIVCGEKEIQKHGGT